MTIFFFILTLVLIINSIISIKNNRPASLFGYTLAVVPTESMEPEIKVGDIVIGKKVDFSDLQIGDDVIYYSETYNIYIIHRIIRQNEDGSFVTKGINENVVTGEDKEFVTKDNYIAKRIYSGNILNLGDLVIKNRNFIFIIIILIFVFIFINETFTIVKTLREEKAKNLLKEDYNIKKSRLIEELKEEIKKEHEDGK